MIAEPPQNLQVLRPVLITGLVGLNCWTLCVLLPAHHLSSVATLSLLTVLLAGLSLLTLACGLAMLAQRARGRGSRRLVDTFVLTGIFPLLIIATATAQPAMLRASVMSSWAVAIAGLSFVAHLLSASWSCSFIGVRQAKSVVVPLEAPPRSWRQRVKVLPSLLVVCSAAVVTIAIGIGHLGEPSARDTGTIRLLSVGSLTLWALALFGILGPALRHRRPWPLGRPSWGTALAWLVVAILAAVMFILSWSE